MYEFCDCFFMFFIFSVVGWITECVFCSLNEKKIITNRGFLIGPYCPIYGLGFLYVALLGRLEDNPLLLFIVAIVGTSALEYFTSYIMEKVFKARWWDYTNEPFNLNGRICLKNAILFGVLGLVFTYIIKPPYYSLTEKIPSNILMIISVVLMVIFFTDLIVSFNIMNKIKNKFTLINKDSTDDIDKEVRNILSKHHFYSSKLFSSFPDIIFRLPNANAIKESIQKIIKKEKEKIKNSR